MAMPTDATSEQSGDRQRKRDDVLIGVGSTPLLWLLVAVVMILAFLLGGGTQQGLWSDAFVQLASLVLLGLLLPSSLSQGTVGTDRLVLIVVALMILLPLCQLLPLPPAIWMALPGRGAIFAAFQLSDIGTPWMPISLDPEATWRSLLSLLPAFAVFFGTVRLGVRGRRSLTLLALAAGVLSVLLGLAQLMQGPGSALRFFPITNPDSSVGFFANRNHYAALLYGLVPFAVAWISGFLVSHRPERMLGLTICLSVYVALLLGLGMALSRAGIILAIVGSILSLLIVGTQEVRVARHGLIIMAAAIAVGAVLVTQFAFFHLLARFDDNALADYRFRIAQITIEAARTFDPIGSGFGTFVPVYQMFEPVEALWPSYVNHAHDDWLEIWLEGGLPSVAIAIGFIVWFIRASAGAWLNRSEGPHDLDRTLPQAASIVILLLLLHSIVDYPLRTTALMTLFAFCCALLIPPARLPDLISMRSDGRDGWPTRHHRGHPVFQTRSRA